MLSYILKKRSWWEHPVIDLWTIPHTLSGALLAYAVIWFGINLWLGLGIGIAIAIGWEIFEKITHISDVEHHTNGASDVIVAQIGYGAGVWLFTTYTTIGFGAGIAACLLLIFGGISLLGWLSHHWYG
ncbi:hypothetical protein IT396_02290 [Candidatus Nomurabacteria bacterium]|nr:hypothetical protein [Candidatus Nomurabacteria bacterium]